VPGAIGALWETRRAAEGQNGLHGGETWQGRRKAEISICRSDALVTCSAPCQAFTDQRFTSLWEADIFGASFPAPERDAMTQGTTLGAIMTSAATPVFSPA